MSSKTFKGALIEARALIANGESNYICDALLLTDNFLFRERIGKQLVCCCSYGNWLRHYHHSTYIKMTDDDLRQGRLQWIDHMISMEK